jgi:hypothetical protein
MTEDEPAEDPPDNSEGKRQLRLLGLGFVLAGAVTYALSNANDPRSLLVVLLGFLGLAALVLERTQSVTSGVSFGLLTGGFAVWAWPFLRAGTAGYDYLGVLMVGVGVINAVMAPIGIYFRRLGRRLGERTTGEE